MSNPTESQIIGQLCTTLKQEIDTQKLDDFLTRIQAAYGYNGNHISWKDEVDCAIEPLEIMALHGDEKSLKILILIGSDIARILDKFAKLAQGESTEKPTTATNGDDVPLDTEVENQRFEKLEQAMTLLAARFEREPKKLQKTIQFFDQKDPAESTLLDPGDLIRNVRTLEYEPKTQHSRRFEALEPLLGKLAGMRARREAVRMARKVMDQSEQWPVALYSLEELRTIQMKNYDTLKIGAKLQIAPKPPSGRGRALGLARQGDSLFALEIYHELEKERTYPRSQAHSNQIQKSYHDAVEQGLMSREDFNNTLDPKMRPEWHADNEWRAMATLLDPLSSRPEVLNAWHEAGMKYFATISHGHTNLSGLPQVLLDNVCKFNESPSKERVQTVVTKALLAGLKSIANRTHSNPST